MNKTLASGLLTAVLTLGWVGAAPQAPATAAGTCAGVWVVVDFGSLGGTSTKCASSYGNGKAALTSAGFSPHLDNGMITQIEGKPSSPDINKSYWSYWTATRKSDGSYSGWSYSNLGATSSHPAKGNAEGWRYQSLSDGKVPPAAAPPAAEAPTATPKPTPTKSSKPKATAKPTATKKPSATASTAGSTPKASTTKSASATPTASPTPAPTTPTPTVTPTPAGTVDAAELGQQQVTDSEPPAPGGSPVGAMVAAGLVVAGGAGVGGWWLLKGRRS